MATANLVPFFNAQFIDDTGVPLASGKLFTYISGTTTNQVTYQDQGEVATNTNPIILDAAGRCNLWVAPALVYTFKLTRADNTVLKTWDNVAGAALAPSVVTSVNSLTGAVSLTAPNIPFTTGTSTTWFVGTDVGAALDSIITHVDGGLPAASVSINDFGNYYTGTNVETALQELGPKVPTQTGNAGKFLTTDGTNTSWSVAGAGTSTQTANGTITFPGGLIMKWGTTATLATDSAANAVTFPTAFPNACFVVQAQATTNNGVSVAANYSWGVYSVTVTGFLLNNDSTASTFSWIAIGN